MEHPIFPLVFNGSISDAIAKAKTQKKLFVVYLSGKNSETNHWETSTWTESNVSEALSKYCILIHILDGSTDAVHFTAIYPQKNVPCITVIGYNGVLLWQTEELGGAEILASKLEKTWLDLQTQEVTATFLTAAALSSKKSLASSCVDHKHGSSDGGDSPDTGFPQNMEDTHVVTPEIVEEAADFECSIEQNEETTSSVIEESVNNKLTTNMGSSQKCNDVLLNIRMPDGSNLQKKLLLADSLSMIKNYVDEYQSSEFGSFDLAIPYPRQVFNDQDMKKSLSDLGLLDRQALLVLPHRKPKPGTSIDAGAKYVAGPDPSSERESDGEGYFGYVKKILSFFNPLSYIGSNSNSTSSCSQDSSVPKNGIQSGIGMKVGPDAVGPRIGTRRFGGNVHGLKLDEEDGKHFDDRNSFWNGNSTQYGGNDKDD